MARYFFNRLKTLPLLFLLASIIIFFLPYMTGIDPTRSIIRARVGERNLSEETIERLTSELGLDQPLIWQYTGWVGQMVQGDFGYSFASQTAVFEILMPAARVTAFLAGSTVGIALLLSLPLGLMTAYWQDSWLDRTITSITQLGVVIPEYFLAPVLVLIFSLSWGLLPSTGWREPANYILPTLTLVLRPLAYFTRITRSTVIEVLLSDYIRTARAKGAREIRVAVYHAMRNALLPVLTLASVWFAGLLGGTVIIEIIFVIPGLGRVLYDATLAGDVPLLQAGLIMVFCLVVLINTATDLVYALLNPTIRLNGA